MSIEFKTETVMVKKERLVRNFEQLIENDLSLPDYCGDIVRILCCNTDVNIFSAVITGDKAVVDGAVVSRILYTDSAAKTELYEVNTPFSRNLDVKGADESDTVEVVCVSEQVSCRAVNQRRCDIRGSVTLRICVTGCEEISFVTGVPEGYCHTLTEQINGNLLKIRCKKSFTLSENSEGEDRFTNAKILRVCPSPVVSEVRTIKNKMMIRGNANTDVTLIDKSGNFITSRIHLPVNQIIEIEGIDEDSQCNVVMNVTAVDARISHETASAPSHIELTATLSAMIEVTEKTVFSAFTEAYAPHHELICQKSDISIISDTHRINETHAVSVKFDFSACKAADVCDTAIKKIRYTVVSENGSAVMKGNIHFGILLRTEEGEKLYFERISDFEHKFSVSDASAETQFNAVVTPLATEASANQDGTVTVHTEFRIDGCLISLREYTAISSIEKSESEKNCPCNSIFTVYFASEGERLWDIAKAHNTCAEKIRSTNPDIGDVTDSDCMLVFEQE